MFIWVAWVLDPSTQSRHCNQVGTGGAHWPKKVRTLIIVGAPRAHSLKKERTLIRRLIKRELVFGALQKHTSYGKICDVEDA